MSDKCIRCGYPLFKPSERDIGQCTDSACMVRGVMKERDAARAEVKRLAAQLLQDAPMAALARAYEAACRAWVEVGLASEEYAAYRRMRFAEDALLDLAQAQREGGE